MVLVLSFVTFINNVSLAHKTFLNVLFTKVVFKSLPPFIKTDPAKPLA